MRERRVATRFGARRQAFASETTRKHRPDYLLIVIVIILLSVGLMVVYSISPALSATRGGSGTSYVTRQSVAIGLGIMAFIATSRIPLRTWRHWQKPLLVVAALGTLVALLTPVLPQYPAHRWIRIGGFSLQSVEILKLALIVWLASFLARIRAEGEIGDFHKAFKPLIITLGIVGVVVAGVQSDLGSTGVIVAIMAAMAFVAGLPMRNVALVLLVVAVGTVLAVSSTPYRRDRLNAYLNPESNCLTSGYQACQALIAVGTGGIAGMGLGNGVQAYGYLPEAQNDSIFAIYAEKFGFIGSTLLIGLFVMLFARMRLIIERAPDMFSRLLVSGILAWVSTQALINIGSMLGLFPLKGITLPLVSYGGTSVVLVGAALGFVFQVSAYTNLHSRYIPEKLEAKKNEDSNDRRRVRGAYHPNLGSRS